MMKETDLLFRAHKSSWISSHYRKVAEIFKAHSDPNVKEAADLILKVADHWDEMTRLLAEVELLVNSEKSIGREN